LTITAERLLRLYPRAWRDCYGDEFLATAGPGWLSVQQLVDIASGAIDAWLSSDVRNATRAISTATSGGRTMTVRAMICRKSEARYTTRDGLIGAGVMLAGTIGLVVMAIVLRRAGWLVAGEMARSLAFPVSMTISMPFWMMKGQPWKAQWVIVGALVAFLVVIGYLAARF
jgi:hypothetical protein